MKIYLATTAPGTEGKTPGKMCDIEKRLLSYYMIINDDFECGVIFEEIKNENLLRIRRTTQSDDGG